jgi:hypothetical protein
MDVLSKNIAQKTVSGVGSTSDRVSGAAPSRAAIQADSARALLL